MMREDGISVSEGLAFSKIFVYQHEKAGISHAFISSEDISSEVESFEKAIKTLNDSNLSVKCSNEEEKSLVDLKIQLLSDPDYKSRVVKLISESLYNASWAIEEVSNEYIGLLSSSKNDYLAARVSDFEDMKMKLIKEISGCNDGPNGWIAINPDEEEFALYENNLKAIKEKEAYLINKSKLPSDTSDGRHIRLLCNIEGFEGIAGVKEALAEGIGLFRTEFMFLQKDLFQNDEKRTKIYSSVASQVKDIGYVTVRTIDVGGDKFTSDLGIIEDNPFLGNRSIRYCMDHKDIFKKQLVSILRSSVYKNVRIMFPFISSPDELGEVLEYFDSVKKECRDKGIAFDEKIKVGTMIEVPSAAISSDIIAQMVDFMSVGTNDLIQYTLAVDRGSSKVSRLYDPLNPAVLRLLKLISDNAAKYGTELSICGEMAGSVEYTPLLIGLGFESLSMASHFLPEIRARIRLLEYKECRALAEHLLSLKSEKEIRKELKDFNNGKARYKE